MADENLLNRIRAEYLEMPGLRLKREQVQRLCGVDPLVCGGLLDALVEMRFLCVKADGTYARFSDDLLDVPRPQPAKAQLRTESRSTKTS
jgi:hypothetical protein